MKSGWVIAVVLFAVMLACLGMQWLDDPRAHDHGPVLEQVRYETPRGSCWKPTRADWIEKHPRCAFANCRSSGPFEVHHVLPFAEFPAHECDTGNLITLCRGGPNHHLWVGHQGNFRESNPNVRDDCRRGTFPEIGWERRERHRKESR